MTKWTVLRSWGPRKLADLQQWRSGVVLLSVDESVATTWGQLQARAQRRGRPRPVNDTWIAACCLVDGLPLATLNVKDFEDFAAHDGLNLVDLVSRVVDSLTRLRQPSHRPSGSLCSAYPCATPAWSACCASVSRAKGLA
ncbi:MAG TPA: PIN domain-containing protein [Micromonosporaceae bacterium]|nr:PIN domain-containing protein [Micromonosporaceae bacterium]